MILKCLHWMSKSILKSKANKFPDRENIPGRLLKECAVELGPAFQPLFKQSVDTGVMSTILV